MAKSQLLVNVEEKYMGSHYIILATLKFFSKIKGFFSP